MREGRLTFYTGKSPESGNRSHGPSSQLCVFAVSLHMQCRLLGLQVPRPKWAHALLAFST